MVAQLGLCRTRSETPKTDFLGSHFTRVSVLISSISVLLYLFIVDLKPCSCAQFAPLASRSYANRSCPYVPRFDLKLNTRYILLWSYSLCLNVLCDSYSLLLRFMCVRDISMAGCAAETVKFHSYKSQKSIILI